MELLIIFAVLMFIYVMKRKNMREGRKNIHRKNS